MREAVIGVALYTVAVAAAVGMPSASGYLARQMALRRRVRAELAR
jgi:hypothetical protein